MEHMTRLVIAIIVWNNADDAIECADSLLAQKGIDDYQIVFVDNASETNEQDKLHTYIQSKDSNRLAFTQTGENHGTAGGFNAAVTWARGTQYRICRIAKRRCGCRRTLV